MLGHILHNTCVERALSDCMAKLKRAAYLAATATANANAAAASSTSSTTNGTGNLTLAWAGAAGLTGVGNGGSRSPRTLPPLAPSSTASSRSGTPRRFHLEEAVFPPPGDIMTASLRRADSGRFDNDEDLLEGANGTGTPRGAGAAAGLRGQQGQGQGQGQPPPPPPRVVELEAENAALKSRVERLELALAELFEKTDRGIFHHSESVLTEGDLASIASLSLVPRPSSMMKSSNSSVHSASSPSSPNFRAAQLRSVSSRGDSRNPVLGGMGHGSGISRGSSPRSSPTGGSPS